MWWPWKGSSPGTCSEYVQVFWEVTFISASKSSPQHCSKENKLLTIKTNKALKETRSVKKKAIMNLDV